MDLPPELLNPPACVYQIPGELQANARLDAALEKIVSEFDDEYYDQIKEKVEYILKFTIPDAYRYDDFNAVEKLKGKQIAHISTHYSHRDYIQQLFNFHEWGFPKTVILGRANVSSKVFKSLINYIINKNQPEKKEFSLKKFRMVNVPSDLSDPVQRRELATNIQAVVYGGYDIFNYAGSGRNRNQTEVGEFATAGFGITFNAAKKFKKDMYLLPQYFGYDHPIEESFFPIVDKVKKRFPEAYPAIDAITFGLAWLSRSIRPRGAVVHALGEPFPLSDFKKSEDALAEAHKRITLLKRIYRPKIENWQGKDTPAKTLEFSEFFNGYETPQHPNPSKHDLN